MMGESVAVVCKEITLSEVTFIGYLVGVVRGVAQPSLRRRLIDDATHARIFSCIEQLTSLHERIAEQFTTAHTPREWAKPFLGNRDELFRLHVAYVARDEASDTAELHRVMRENAPFRTLCERQGVQEQGLEALLKGPGNRMLRYQLLFAALLKGMGPTHADYAVVLEALRMFAEISDAMTAARQLAEKRHELDGIVAALGDRGNEIQSPARLLLGVCSVGFQSRARTVAAKLVFFNDAVLLCKIKPKEKLKLVAFGARADISFRVGTNATEFELTVAREVWRLRASSAEAREEALAYYLR